LQECLDKVMLHICGHFGRKTGLRKLAMAGGVALNCTANGRILQYGLFDDIYVMPAAGDDGSALGTALWSASCNGGVENVQMQDRINAMVKMREAYRPVAPAVSLEQVQDWFKLPEGIEFPYMIMTADVRPEHRAALPAITHVNGSARVQTINKKDNPEFHALVQAVGQVTGREMVLNTSFNVKGQPIVNTPREAIDTFLSTGIEFLFLENTLIRRAAPK